MRPAYFVMGVCALLACSSGGAQSSLQAQSVKPTPLILEKNEGERRVWRPVVQTKHAHGVIYKEP